MAEVRLQDGESLENALRRFKRKVQTEDIIKEVKRHSYYLKPGERRRLKQALARKRAEDKHMTRVAVLLLLLSLAIVATAFAAGIRNFVNAGHSSA